MYKPKEAKKLLRQTRDILYGSLYGELENQDVPDFAELRRLEKRLEKMIKG